MTQIRNKPSVRGNELGLHMARLCDDAEQSKMVLRPRCGTCAFRAGTFPNGCESTLMDALKCAMEGTVFVCHESKEGKACSGWLSFKFPKRVEAPWPFTGEEKKP